MTPTTLGIFLSQTVLDSTWFQILAAFVAFNTLLYVGLVVAKLGVWPDQARTRRLVARLTGRSGREAAPAEAAPGEPARPATLRSALTTHDVPFAMAWVGAIVMILSAALIFVGTDPQMVPQIAGMALGAAILLTAQIFARLDAGDRAASWAWAASAVAIAAFLASPLADQHQYLVMPLLLLVLSASSFVLVSWAPFLVGGTLTMAATGVAIWRIAPPEPVAWILVAGAALAVGALTLHTRLRAIRTMEEVNRISQSLATTDPATGALTRSGIRSLAPRVLGTARRVGESVCVMYVSFPDLDRAEADYGRGYATRVVEVVGDAIGEAVREGDLVARWDDGAFVVLGLGDRPDPGMLRKRVQGVFDHTGLDLGKWPVNIAAGSAAGDPSAPEALSQLVEQAEASAVERFRREGHMSGSRESFSRSFGMS